MYCVYLLRDKQGKMYVGYSANLKRRLAEHMSKKVYWTRRLEKPVIVYYEAYCDFQIAQIREKQLKRFASTYTALIKRLGYK